MEEAGTYIANEKKNATDEQLGKIKSDCKLSERNCSVLAVYLCFC